MDSTKSNEITFDGLKRFLGQIGFGPPTEINHSLAFHHEETGTMIVLSIPKDGRSVRPADITSVEFRLQQEGLLIGSLKEAAHRHSGL